MFGDKLHLYPIGIVIYVPVSFIITYGMAVGYGHVDPGFPYISDTGTKPPESCVFGQLLNIGAVIGAVTFYIRYKQIETYQHACPVRTISRWNKVSFALGLITAFGISLVGNFQESNVIAVHLLGAFMAFLIGGIYCYTQTYLSYQLPEIPGSSRALRHARLIISLLDVVFLIVLSVTTMIANNKYKKIPGTTQEKWTVENGGFEEHITSTASEWLIAFLTCIFVATFTPEFKQFRMINPKLHFHESVSQTRVPNGLTIDSNQGGGAPT